MADQKVSALPSATPVSADYVYLVDDPAGTPSSKRATVGAVIALVDKAFVDALNVDADTLDGSDSTAFATAAQGALADSATQPADNVSTLTNDANYVASADVATIAQVTQAQYDALSPPDANTLYVIIG